MPKTSLTTLLILSLLFLSAQSLNFARSHLWKNYSPQCSHDCQLVG